jgi:hypothetical protein
MSSRSGSPCADKNPHISSGITADGVQIPAARRGKNIARAPFISRLIPATTQVGIWAPVLQPQPDYRTFGTKSLRHPVAGAFTLDWQFAALCARRWADHPGHWLGRAVVNEHRPDLTNA